jgi:hypothetical protein
MKTNIHFQSYLAQLFLEWRIFQTKVVEKLETHILCWITFYFENRAVYQMWENVERCRLQMIWRMRMACCILKATNPHAGCVVLYSLLFHCSNGYTKRAWMLRHTYTAGLFMLRGTGIGYTAVQVASCRLVCAKSPFRCEVSPRGTSGVRVL